MSTSRFSQAFARVIGFLVAASLLALLTACPRPLMLPPTGEQGGTGEEVTGRADFGARQLQATIKDDLAPGATISLIEVETGQTLSTTRTDEDGNFILKYSNGFKPVAGALYYFEAIKGLKGIGGVPNAVGSDAVRVRTIASYRSGGWVTLTSSRVTTNIAISPMTTALSVVVSLRLGTAKQVDPRTLFGAIKAGQPQGDYPDTVVVPNPTLVPLAMVQGAYDLVLDSLSSERDPLRWIALDSLDPNKIMLPEVPFSISFLNPRKQVIGQDLDLVGSNFSRVTSQNVVHFTADGGGRVQAAIKGEVSGDLSTLKVTVPSGAISGPVFLTIDGKTVTTDPDVSFQLDVRDGHSVVRTMQGVPYLFVANPGMDTIARIGPSGDVIPFITRAANPDLISPQALTFGPDDALYVACGGTSKKVLRIAFDAASNPLPATVYSGALNNPSGMAFDPNGDLFVSDLGSPNRIYRIPNSMDAIKPATALALTGPALDQPRGLSFGPDGNLYVANSGGNNVLAVVTATGTVTEYLTGLSKPWSVAFDSKDNFYVSNNAGNSIYRKDAQTGMVSAFASLPNPGGLDADPSGYIYCADNISNQIYQVNSQGDTRLLASGLSSPLGIHVDADGIFVLTEAGRILKISHADQSLTLFADGLSLGRDLYRDAAKNFYVYHPSLGRVTRLTPAGLIDSYLPVSNVSDIYVAGTKLYLKKSNTLRPNDSWSGHGGVEVRDLSTPTSWTAISSSEQAYIRDPIGIAFDNSNGPFRHGMYVAHYDDGSVAKMDKDLRFSRFLTRQNAPELIFPYDVWVEPSNGNVWVSVHGQDTATDGLYVYSPAGAQLKNFSTVVNRPTKFGFDGTTLFLADYNGNRVLKLDRNIDNPAWAAPTHYALGAAVRTMAFDTATQTMYIGSGNGWIYKVPNYLAPTPGSHTQFNNFNATDLHFHTDGHLYAVNGYSHKIEKDGSNRYEFRKSRGSLSDFAVRDDGVIWHSDRYGRLSPWTNDWDSQQWGGMPQYGGAGAVAVDGAGRWVSTNRLTCGGMLVMVDWQNGTQTTPHLFGKSHCNDPFADMCSDGANRIYMIANPTGQLMRLDLSTNNLAQVAKKYGNGDFSHGVSVYNGTVYQSIKTRHKVDRYNVATNADMGALLVGLVSPEL